MKMLTTSESQSKSGASTSRKLSLSSTNLHSDHVIILDSLTASLKDELKRGLTLVDSIVNQLAQAKWVLLNVDKTLEELYENCPACDINANKKSKADGVSMPASGNKTKLKVLPMVSGHTFQRPNITVTRVEEERRESAARSRANPTPASTPTPEPSSSPVAHSSAHPTPGAAPPARRGATCPPKKKAKPKRKPPPRKASTPSTTASNTPSASSPSSTTTTVAVASTSRRKMVETVKKGFQTTGISPSIAQKRPGPKSKTVPHDTDLPVLVREGSSSGDDVTILSNGPETQTSEVATCSVKSPPTLVAYHAENTLKITSFSLSRDKGPATFVPSGNASSSQGSTTKVESSGALASSSNVVSSSTSALAKRPSSSSQNSGATTKYTDFEKKRKLATSSTPDKKDDQPSMEDLLQLKFQKFRDQQRKRELERKAAAAKADSGSDDVVEIPTDYSGSSKTQEEREETSNILQLAEK